jgi:hypothetical protein
MAEQPAALSDRVAEPALRRGPAKPTLSIVMYFVKPAPFLNEALASIVAQRGDEVELIVVAGHPADEDLGIAPPLRAAINRLIVEPDRGAWEAANKGWRAARGCWVQFCMSDDWLPEGSLAETLRLLRDEAEADLLSGGMRFVAAAHSGGMRVVRTVAAQELTLDRVLDDVCSPALVYRRALLDRLGGFDSRFAYAHDRELLLRAWRLGVRHRRLPHETYWMRIHDLSRTNSGDRSVKLCYLRDHATFADALLASSELGSAGHEELCRWRDEELAKHRNHPLAWQAAGRPDRGAGVALPARRRPYPHRGGASSPGASVAETCRRWRY